MFCCNCTTLGHYVWALSFICLRMFSVWRICALNLWMAFFAFDSDAFRSSSHKTKHASTFCAQPNHLTRVECALQMYDYSNDRNGDNVTNEAQFLLPFTKRLPTVYSNIPLTLVVWLLMLNALTSLAQSHGASKQQQHRKRSLFELTAQQKSLFVETKYQSVDAATAAIDKSNGFRCDEFQCGTKWKIIQWLTVSERMPHASKSCIGIGNRCQFHQVNGSILSE